MLIQSTPWKVTSPLGLLNHQPTKGFFMFIHDLFQIIEQILEHLGPFEGLSAGMLEVCSWMPQISWM